MNYSVHAPLHLFQVLEEEYVSLAEDGALTEKEVITLHRRSGIIAKLDWKFYEGHIKDPDGLLKKLEHDSDLHRHLRTVMHEAKSEGTQDAGATETLEDTLNKLLERPIYNEEAFKHIKLPDAIYAAIKPHMIAPSTGGAMNYLRGKWEKIGKSLPRTAEASDDLAHVNRLILEETFPDELEKISDIRLAAMYQRLHRKKAAALSLSGGGIRSGTFALGLIQRLARFGVLDKFDYLSTVSGGGYIGSWLTAWAHRHPQGLDGVNTELENTPPESKIDPDPPAIQHLRDYSNFLTPKVGLLTADTWTFVAIYVRNLLLNWMVLIPLLAAVLALPRLFVALNLSQPGDAPVWDFFGIPFSIRHIFLVIGSALLSLAITYVSLNRPGINQQLIERSPFWRKRMRQEGFLKWCLLPVVSAAILLTIYLAWSLDHQRNFQAEQPSISKWVIYTIAGAAIPFVAYLAYVIVLERWRPKYWNEFNIWEILGGLLLIGVGAAGGALSYATSQMTWLDPTGSNVDESWRTELYTCVAVPMLLLLLLILMSIFIGWTSRLRGIEDEDREWWARCKAWLLIVSIAWASLNALVIFGPYALLEFPQWITPVGGISGLISLLAGQSSKTPANAEQGAQKGLLASIISEHILPLLAFVFLAIFLICVALGTTLLLRVFATLGTEIASFAFGDNWYRIGATLDGAEHMRVVHYATFWFIASFVTISAAAGLLMGLWINLNKFSLHAGYRNRLIRAYLGASRDENKRNPNPFTGFDPQDNIQMHELRPALFHETDFEDLESLAAIINEAPDDLSKFLKDHLSDATRESLSRYTPHTPLEAQLRIDLIEDLNRILENEKISASGDMLIDTVPTALQTVGDIIRKRIVLFKAYPKLIRKKYPPAHRLLHVVNLTLNLVGGKNLAWQQRKAETFAVTPLHSGCFRIGYRKSRFYGGPDGISLGTAAAVSGAAVSSNMGYYTSSPTMSLVLTLFNVRLGWWLGNPGPAGDKTYYRATPLLSITPVVSEALGLTNDTNKYVYLSDGGHFENLAMYEMVLRRCHIIVVSDAAADPDYEFGDLGNAIRKIRIDLGVPIEFEDVPIYKKTPEGKEGEGRYCAFARIGYSAVDGEVEDGVLIYIKPAIYGSEPRDVLQYKKANQAFPHQSTGDQFFDEPQFESYRALGAYIMDSLCDNTSGDNGQPAKLTLQEFVEQAYENYKKPGFPFSDLAELEWLKKWIYRSGP
jgi:hypothetical protein